MNIELIITAREQLTSSESDDMEALYNRYYCGADDDGFQRDLAQKDWVILLKQAGTVQGFSTQKLHECEGDVFLFSGDTVVDRAIRSQTGLAGAFGHLMEFLNARYPADRLFWLLISKGPRTYRFLPTFFNVFYPNPDGAHTQLRGRLDRIATQLFNASYSPATHILHFTGAKDRLRSEWACEDEARDDSETRFFKSINPGWRDGDELACMTPLAIDNLNRLGRRVIAQNLPQWRLG